jgi:hypothetical protein
VGAAESPAAPTVCSHDYSLEPPPEVSEDPRMPKTVLRAPKRVESSDEDGMSAPCFLDGDAPRIARVL